MLSYKLGKLLLSSAHCRYFKIDNDRSDPRSFFLFVAPTHIQNHLNPHPLPSSFSYHKLKSSAKDKGFKRQNGAFLYPSHIPSSSSFCNTLSFSMTAKHGTAILQYTAKPSAIIQHFPSCKISTFQDKPTF